MNPGVALQGAEKELEAVEGVSCVELADYSKLLEGGKESQHLQLAGKGSLPPAVAEGNLERMDGLTCSRHPSVEMEAVAVWVCMAEFGEKPGS